MSAVSAAFFDLDKTVIAKPSITAFGRPFRRGGLINRRVILRTLIGQLVYLQLGAGEQRLARVRESTLALTKGWDQDRVRTIVRESLLATIEPLIFDEALELMTAHRAVGDRVYLVSTAPEEIVLPLSELLGADGAIASVAETDDHGRYTGQLAFYAYGEGKATAMRELAARAGLDLERSSAYSDSATDLPMLEAVGHPVAVNPDRALARMARQRGWEVRQFTQPVRLRNHVAVRTPVFTSSVVLAAAAALLVWRGRRSRRSRRLARAAGARRFGAGKANAARSVARAGPAI